LTALLLMLNMGWKIWKSMDFFFIFYWKCLWTLQYADICIKIWCAIIDEKLGGKNSHFEIFQTVIQYIFRI